MNPVVFSPGLGCENLSSLAIFDEARGAFLFLEQPFDFFVNRRMVSGGALLATIFDLARRGILTIEEKKTRKESFFGEREKTVPSVVASGGMRLSSNQGNSRVSNAASLIKPVAALTVSDTRLRTELTGRNNRLLLWLLTKCLVMLAPVTIFRLKPILPGSTGCSGCWTSATARSTDRVFGNDSAAVGSDPHARKNTDIKATCFTTTPACANQAR